MRPSSPDRATRPSVVAREIPGEVVYGGREAMNSDPEKKPSLRIATWNIGGGFIASTADVYDVPALDYFVQQLDPLDCDLVCLQEVHEPSSPVESGQASYLAERLRFPYHTVKPISPSHLEPNQMLSLAILSRYAISSTRYTQLTNPHLEAIGPGGRLWHTFDKGFLCGFAALGDQQFHVICGHAVPFHIFKRDFMDPAFSNIRSEVEDVILCDASPGLVAADLNYADIRSLIPRVLRAGYESGLANEPTSRDHLKLDDILASRDWKFLGHKVVPTQADHHLCFADVRLR